MSSQRDPFGDRMEDNVLRRAFKKMNQRDLKEGRAKPKAIVNAIRSTSIKGHDQ